MANAPGLTDAADSCAKTADKPKRSPWVVRVSVAFLDARTNPLPPRLKMMMMTLECFARNRPYCWPENRKLMAHTGLSERSVQQRLVELERAGMVKRVLNTAEQHRWGLVLLKRTHPDSPAWDANRPTEEAYVLLKRHQKRRSERLGRSAEICAPTPAEICAPILNKTNGVKKTKCLKTDTPLPPKGEPEGARVTKEGTDEDLRPAERQKILGMAAWMFRPDEVAEIERDWPRIVKAISANGGLEHFYSALVDAHERRRGDPIQSPAKWCLKVARNAIKANLRPTYRWSYDHTPPVSHPLPV